MKERALPIKCNHCSFTALEFIKSPEYPNGAIRVVHRHHGVKHSNTFPLESIIGEEAAVLLVEFYRQRELLSQISLSEAREVNTF